MGMVEKQLWEKRNGRMMKTDQTVMVPEVDYDKVFRRPTTIVGRVKKLASRAVAMIRKPATFARVVSGPKVAEEVAAERLRICESCDKLRRKDDKLYCGACGCPRWSMSELHTALTFELWKCRRKPPLF